MRKIVLPFLIITILLAATLILIALGRGYRFSTDQKSLTSTGLLVAASDPAGAEIFIDGKLKSATNTTISLPPGWYQVKIQKDGFLPWEKKLRLQGEIVSETQAYLFPSTPTLIPLTTTGVIAPTLSPDGTRIVYAVGSKAGLPAEVSTKAGLWTLNLNPTPLGFSKDPQLLTRSANLDFSSGNFSWSPDSKQILVNLDSDRYLVNADQAQTPQLLDALSLANLEKDWNGQTQTKEEERLAVLPKEFVRIATQSAKILALSPDENKILYQATASAELLPILVSPPPATNPTSEIRELKTGQIYVYDLKEDKNYLIGNWSLEIGHSLSWFPTSRHLILAEKGKISIMEYDGTNQVTIYNGPFKEFLTPAAGGKKLLILTSYNRPDGEASGSANLYSINLR